MGLIFELQNPDFCVEFETWKLEMGISVRRQDDSINNEKKREKKNPFNT